MWLTKAVDISVSYPVHVVVYTVPSLRRPPVLLVPGNICLIKARPRNETEGLPLAASKGVFCPSL